MKKKMFCILLVISILVSMLPEMNLAAYAEETPVASNWMKYIDGAKTLAQFNIPGTHDAGSKDCSLGKCQGQTIQWQLEHGVRFLDIRLKQTGGDLEVYHGSFSADLKFGDVMKTVKTFLANNPSECVIMSIKNESDKDEVVQLTLTNLLCEMV